MDSSEDARATTPDFLRYYSDLNPDNIRLSTTEVRVIAAIRADKHVTENECARREQEWYCDVSRMHNQTARIALLESLLEYHRIPLPA
ncbi:hypothetical protein R3P38DRAFT_3232467 [Favolaschia claudopus]|uniref:Uncharacterized protein n=1 Tax=Favolaschia claudopus TaxID=2862362 RepID=A0AAV9ZJ74_9AGAR